MFYELLMILRMGILGKMWKRMVSLSSIDMLGSYDQTGVGVIHISSVTLRHWSRSRKRDC